jgi:hypothetical protein
MHHKRSKLAPKAITLLGLAAFSGATFAQSSDALIDKLVDKGILTVKEAQQLREETDKGFTQAYQVKSGMPDWVTTFKLGGDMRARYDGIFNPNPAPNSPSTTIINDRHRFRYRLRFGAVATIKDNFEVGLRLTSGEYQGGTFGGDPISGNVTYGDNASKKFIFIDQAYGKWTALNTPTFMAAATIGKMENPFVFSEMVFDPDYTPEGLGLNLAYNLSDSQSLKFNGGGFLLDENSGNANNPYLGGAQLRLDSTWTPKIQTTFGGALLTILAAREGLTSSAMPDLGHGNLRGGVPGTLTNELNSFTTFVADAGVTYTLESFPFYNAAFPIKATAEYMENLAATTGRKHGYGLGLTFGKSGKKGLWDVSYRWKELQGDVWYEELVDSDFGGYYQTPSLFANGTGYKPGVNLRGHVIKGQYSFTDAFTLAATAYIADVIDTVPGTIGGKAIKADYDSQVLRIQIDAIWKF